MYHGSTLYQWKLPGLAFWRPCTLINNETRGRKWMQRKGFVELRVIALTQDGEAASIAALDCGDLDSNDFICACQRGHSADIVNLKIALKAYRYSDETYNTSLFQAAINNHLNVVEILLKEEFELDYRLIKNIFRHVFELSHHDAYFEYQTLEEVIEDRIDMIELLSRNKVDLSEIIGFNQLLAYQNLPHLIEIYGGIKAFCDTLYAKDSEEYALYRQYRLYACIEACKIENAFLFTFSGHYKNKAKKLREAAEKSDGDLTDRINQITDALCRESFSGSENRYFLESIPAEFEEYKNKFRSNTQSVISINCSL